MRYRRVSAVALATMLAVVCGCPSRPSTSRPLSTDAAADADAGDPVAVRKVWARTRVSLGVGDVHNLRPEEKRIVEMTVHGRTNDVRKCFEDPIRRRGCRTGGIPAAFDAMLMIEDDGTVRHVRIVPNKNDLPRNCHDAVLCVQDVLTGLEIRDLYAFAGTRQAYMTVTLIVPSEADLAEEADEGDAEAATSP